MCGSWTPERDGQRQETTYGGDGPINLFTGPFWHPSGGEALFGGTGSTRFPGQETEPAALLVEAPGTERDRHLVTRPAGQTLHALGWRADGQVALALAEGENDEASLVVAAREGGVVREIAMPGKLRGFGAAGGALLPPIRRVAGVTRTQTAVEVSQAAFPAGGADDEPGTVVLARADDYADALSGAPLARHLGAPLLLTGRTALDEATAQEIGRLNAREAVLLGGTSAIGPEVQAQLLAMGLLVRRVSGPDRFSTAVEAARELPEGDRVVLVQGAHADPARGWPDAVSAAPLAAAAEAPLLLTLDEQLAPVTEAYLREQAPGTVTVVGGTSAVSDAVARQAATAAGGSVRRIAGANRVATSVAVADAQIQEGNGSALSLWLATTRNWPDALAAGPAVAAVGGVLLLAPPDAAGSELAGFLARTESRIARVVGGHGVIGDAALYHLLLSAGLGGPDARPLDLP